MAENTNIEDLKAPLLAALGAADLALATVNDLISYTHYLAEIDEGRSPNVPAPAIAKTYWGLPETATLRAVVLVVRADEAHHRDVNHSFADELAGLSEPKLIPAVWPHQPLEPHWREAA